MPKAIIYLGEEQLPPASQEGVAVGRRSYQSNGGSQERTHRSEDAMLEEAFTDSTKHESSAPLA